MRRTRAWSCRFEGLAHRDPSQKEECVMHALGRLATAILITGQLFLPKLALAADTVTYLFPAPPSLPAFGPIRLAKGKGYFAQEGLEVNFAVARGGVDVAKQVGA